MGREKKNAMIRQHTEKKQISPLIVFLAFLAGAAAAFAALLGIRVSKHKKNTGRDDRAGTADRDDAQSDAELNELLRQLRSEYERRDSLERDSARSDLKVFSVQTQQIKAYRPRKRLSGKKIFGRAVAVAVAAALVVTGLYLAPSDRVPVSVVQAKERESFGGIKQVVESHNEKEPFVILDIVPGKAQAEVKGKKYDFSLGTIGYLTSGQSPIQKDLLTIFKGNVEKGTEKDFYLYTDRKALTDAVITDGYDGTAYQEAYAGTGVNLKPSEWSPVFAQVKDVERDENGKPIGVPTGRLVAYVQERNDGTTGTDNLPKRDGFDYNLVASNVASFRNTAMSVPKAEGIYTFAENQGDYHVTFGEPALALSGYRAEVIKSGTFDELVGSYPETTGLYIVENGVYAYVGVIGNHTGTIGPDEPKPEEPEPPIDENDPGEDTENPGGDTENPGGDTENPGGDTENPGGDTENPGGDTENPGGDTENPGGDTENPGGDTENPGGDTGNPGGNTGNPGGDTGNPGGNTGNPGGETGNPEGNTENPGGDAGGQETPTGESQIAPESAPSQPTASVSRGQSVSTGWYLCVNPGTDPSNPGTDPSNLGTDPSNPGTDPSNPGTDPSNPGTDPSNPGTNPSNPGDGTGNPVGDQPEQPPVPQPEVPVEGTYCILKFTYVETEQEEFLYQIKDIKPVSEENVPWDSYLLEKATFLNGLNAMGEADVLATDTEAQAQFEYVGEGRGRYQLRQAPTGSKISDGAGTDGAPQDGEQQETDGQEAVAQAVSVRAAESSLPYDVEVLNAPVYIRCVNDRKDWLKRYVFQSLQNQDNASSEFAIQVNPEYAGDVTSRMIEEADLVYLEDGAGLYLAEGAKKIYINAMESAGGDDGAAVQSRDISYGAIAGLVKEAVESLKPIIVDYGIIENANEAEYAGSDYQTLAKVFLKYDLAAYYQEMGKSGDLAANLLMNVGSNKFPDKKENYKHYVNRNIYMVNGTPNSKQSLTDDDFPTEMVKNEAKDGFGEVLAAIREENILLPEDERIAEKVSKAMAVQYIINYSLGLVGEYKDLSILELQPTANIESDLHYEAPADKERVVLYWQRQDRRGEGQQILRSSRKIKIDKELYSVAAFNTSHEDINEAYNMIFIGLDGQRLYKDNMLQTVYNDPGLIGKVYHRGDCVAGSETRYDENDITAEKKKALLDYLEAGYPIVVENDCFTGGSARKAEVKDINEKYIAKDTQMYAFFEEVITKRADQKDDEESNIGLYTIEDVHSSAMFAMQLKALRPKVELQRENDAAPDGGENGDEEQKEQIGMIPAEPVEDRPGIVRGTFAYRISSDKTGDDRAYGRELDRHLYLDLNYDGIFAPEEKIAGYQHEQTADGGTISVDFNEINSGIVPWKLEVADHGNQYRRAATQGYFTITGNDKTKIRVLQILDDTKNDYANFEEQYKKVENSMLAYYLKTAEGRANIKWDIKTIEPGNGKDGLKELLDKNPNYLSLWDVVVLGFGESRNPGESVTKAVNEFVAAGGSVLISSAGASEETGRLGLSTAVLGQKDGKTYGKLGLHSPSQYRYKGVEAYMFNKTPSLFLDCINEGVITKWPLQVNTRAQLGSATKVSMPDYLLDIGEKGSTGEGSGTGQPRTTAWFTLLDTDASSDGSTAGAYSVSPRDGRNNYYVYSKGNVVYVGQSQYPYIYDEENGKSPEGEGPDECKIFVNALMAAYNGGVHRANVSIVAGFNGVNKVESVTIPYDVAFKEDGDTKGGILGDTVDVYFRFTDNNIAVDKTTKATFYYKNANAAEDATLLLPEGGINGNDYTDFTARTPIWTVENNRLVEVTDGSVVPGKVYRIKAPLEAMQLGEEEQSQICVLLTNNYTRAGQIVEAFSMDSVSLNRAQMFLLE